MTRMVKGLVKGDAGYDFANLGHAPYRTIVLARYRGQDQEELAEYRLPDRTMAVVFPHAGRGVVLVSVQGVLRCTCRGMVTEPWSLCEHLNQAHATLDQRSPSRLWEVNVVIDDLEAYEAAMAAAIALLPDAQ